MLRAVGGSRIFIGRPGHGDPGPIPEADWAEISHAESLGNVGVSWETHEDHALTDGEGGMPSVHKTVRRSTPMQIVLGADEVDDGQIRLWEAVRDDCPYPFRILIPDGRGGWSARYWAALVTSLEEAFDSANAVIKLVAELRPTSDLHRGEEND